MRKVIAVLLALTMALSLAACGSNESPNTDGQAGQAGKDTVVIAIGDEPTTLDPTKGWGHGNAPIMQSTLVRYNRI